MHLIRSRSWTCIAWSRERRCHRAGWAVAGFLTSPASSQSSRSETLSDISTSLVSAVLICCLYVFIIPIGSRKHCYLSVVCLPFYLLLQSVRLILIKSLKFNDSLKRSTYGFDGLLKRLPGFCSKTENAVFFVLFCLLSSISIPGFKGYLLSENSCACL